MNYMSTAFLIPVNDIFSIHNNFLKLKVKFVNIPLSEQTWKICKKKDSVNVLFFVEHRQVMEANLWC